MLNAAVFAIGRGSHEPQRPIGRAFLQRDPGRNGKHLFLGPVRPVGLVGALQCRLQRLHCFDLSFGPGEIANACHAQAPREADQRIRHGILAGSHRQIGRACPIGPFQDVTRRHRGLGGEIGEVDRTIAAVGGGERLLDHRLGFGILRELQMCIDRKIRRMIIVRLDLKR